MLREIRGSVVTDSERIERANTEIIRARLHVDYHEHETLIPRQVATGCFLWLGGSHNFLVSSMGIARMHRLAVEFNAPKRR